MAKHKVGKGENVMDIVMKFYGDVSGLPDFISRNNLDHSTQRLFGVEEVDVPLSSDIRLENPLLGTEERKHYGFGDIYMAADTSPLSPSEERNEIEQGAAYMHIDGYEAVGVTYANTADQEEWEEVVEETKAFLPTKLTAKQEETIVLIQDYVFNNVDALVYNTSSRKENRLNNLFHYYSILFEGF